MGKNINGTYFPDKLVIKEHDYGDMIGEKNGTDGTMTIVDEGEDDYMAAILLTIGHPQTDLPDEELMSFAQWAVEVLNKALAEIKCPSE